MKRINVNEKNIRKFMGLICPIIGVRVYDTVKRAERKREFRKEYNRIFDELTKEVHYNNIIEVPFTVNEDA